MGLFASPSILFVSYAKASDPFDQTQPNQPTIVSCTNLRTIKEKFVKDTYTTASSTTTTTITTTTITISIRITTNTTTIRLSSGFLSLKHFSMPLPSCYPSPIIYAIQFLFNSYGNSNSNNSNSCGSSITNNKLNHFLNIFFLPQHCLVFIHLVCIEYLDVFIFAFPILTSGIGLSSIQR